MTKRKRGSKIAEQEQAGRKSAMSVTEAVELRDNLVQRSVIRSGSPWYSSVTSSIGFRLRKTVPGPENDLVEWFLEHCPVEGNNRRTVTVFREPKLESGFPDLVIVEWNPRSMHEWPAARTEITTEDLRVIQYLVQAGPSLPQKVNDLLSIDASVNLSRLCEAGMVSWIGQYVSAMPLDEIFAISSIISVEAKMSNWSSVLSQAHLNTWFSSESFILVPYVPVRSDLLEVAQKWGIGVWVQDESNAPICPVSPHRHSLPRSYVSWVFNEWLWRAMIANSGSGG